MILALLMVNWLTFWRDTNSHAATAHGVKAYGQKKYADAVKSFAKASAAAPTPARAFNLGTAQIAAGNREAGSSSLDAAMRDPSLRADALFNRGNAALAASAYDYAIRDYTDVLKLRSRDAAAKRNLEIAIRKRALQQKTNGGGQNGGASQQPQEQKTQLQPQQQQQPKSDPNTEALLRSVQQQEQEELQRMNRPVRRKAHVGW